jgi:hypothetical protein
MGFGAVGVAMLWRSVCVEMGMCICIGSMNICRNFRREVLDKRSHAIFEPFGAGLGDWCVRVRVIGKDFASLSRVPSHAPKTIWARRAIGAGGGARFGIGRIVHAFGVLMGCSKSRGTGEGCVEIRTTV